MKINSYKRVHPDVFYHCSGAFGHAQPPAAFKLVKRYLLPDGGYMIFILGKKYT